jgi:hypothetical protein
VNNFRDGNKIKCINTAFITECIKKVDTCNRKKSRKKIKYDLIYSKVLFSKKSYLAMETIEF